MIVTDVVLTFDEREWVAIMVERLAEVGYVADAVTRRKEGLSLRLQAIVLSGAAGSAEEKRAP